MPRTGCSSPGEAAISFMSSSLRARVAKEGKFKWASVPLPYHDDVIAQPKNGVLGGASLWTLTSQDPHAGGIQGRGGVLPLISDVDQDLWWHKATGYVPITLAGYEKAKAEGYYAQNPGADAAILQLSRAEPTPNSAGFRLGGLVEIRNIIQEELEKALQGQQTATAGARERQSAGQCGAAELRAGEQGAELPREGAALPGPLPPKAERPLDTLRQGRRSDRKVVFNGKLLPYLLLPPQLAVTFVFFFWPAGQAVWPAVPAAGRLRPAARPSSGFEISPTVRRPAYRDAVRNTLGLLDRGHRARDGRGAAAGGAWRTSAISGATAYRPC